MREGIYTAGYLGVGPSVREYIVAQHGTLARMQKTAHNKTDDQIQIQISLYK
jgi:hypothetical protein